MGNLLGQIQLLDGKRESTSSSSVPKYRSPNSPMPGTTL